MSVCLCSYADGVLGACVRGPHIARKSGRSCPNCGEEVRPGQCCVDHAGLKGTALGVEGFFGRFHEECFDLMVRFSERLGCDGWSWPFDLEEAAQHAMAHGDDPFWRDWLLLYERTWKYA